jgi:nucleoside-triphosphatase THEP1
VDWQTGWRNTTREECLSHRFIDDMTALFNGSNIVVVATSALKGEGFIRQVKNRPDCRLIMVTRKNRDRLLGELASELEKTLRRRRA